MFKCFDYVCMNNNCKLANKSIELLVYDNFVDEQRCEQCKRYLTRVLSATRGYVKGTDNYVPIKH